MRRIQEIWLRGCTDPLTSSCRSTFMPRTPWKKSMAARLLPIFRTQCRVRHGDGAACWARMVVAGTALVERVRCALEYKLLPNAADCMTRFRGNWCSIEKATPRVIVVWNLC